MLNNKNLEAFKILRVRYHVLHVSMTDVSCPTSGEGARNVGVWGYSSPGNFEKQSL